MRCHLIEGEDGCAFAVERRCVAVIVDALRASATAAMLLDAGAVEIIVAREVEDALAIRRQFHGALLFGERGGLPPVGFDFGNSPREAAAARGKRVIFTTTTGAQRLIDCYGAHAVYMGTTLNAASVARMAARHAVDIVLIPAGLSGDSYFDAQEDWVAATTIAEALGAEIAEGARQYSYWQERIEATGVLALFETAPHAEKLRNIGLEADIAYCARVDVTSAVPQAVGRTGRAVIVRDARGIPEGESHVSI